MTRALHAIEQTQVQGARRVDGAVDLRFDSRTAWYRVVRLQSGMQLIAFGDARAVPPINDGHGDDHALGEGADGRQKYRRLLQPPVEGHLRQVLMIQVPAVGAPGLVLLLLEDRRELLAST